MTNTETSSSQNGLTEDKNLQESTKESIDPVGENDLPEGAKNVQHAIQLAREREKKAQQEAEEYRKQLADIKAAEKRKQLADMSEVEQATARALEAEAKAAKLEIRSFVRDEINGKNLPKPVMELLVETPWSIPSVQRELDSGAIENTWEDIASSVRRHLPAYIDSLVVDQKPIQEESSSRMVDSERTIDSSVVKRHVYTRDEIAKIGSDPVEWAKHEEAIKKQIAENGGRLPL